MPITHEISFAETAAIEIVMAAFEAYEARRRAQKTPIETYGHLWGHRRIDGDVKRVRVSQVSTSVLALRKPDQVTPNPYTLGIKNEVMSRLAPDLCYLGDYHTHPYVDRNEVLSCDGWKFSPEDFSSFVADDESWENSGAMPIMLVATVCPLKRVHTSWPCWEQGRQNVLRFDVADFRVWINAAAGYLDKDGSRRITGNERSSVSLRSLPLELFTETGDRFGSKT